MQQSSVCQIDLSFFFYVTNTFLGHIICMIDRPDVVECEMFSAEFSTGTILWNERQTLAFFTLLKYTHNQ